MPVKGQQRLGSTGLGMSILEGQLCLDEIVMIQMCGGKDDEDGAARKMEKRKAKKVCGYEEGGHAGITEENAEDREIEMDDLLW